MDKIYKTHYDKKLICLTEKLDMKMFQEFSLLLNDMLKCQKIYADP